jgi:DnaJ-class molecular chaperone
MHSPDRRSVLWAVLTAPLAWLASGCDPETMRNNVSKKCSKCNGTGKVSATCTFCNGTGSWGFNPANRQRCSSCNGTGSSSTMCTTCGGIGRTA